MEKSIIIALFIFGLVAIQSCNDTTTPNKEEAYRITVKEFNSTPNYEWFKQEMQAYQPDTNFINQIKQLYNPNKDKFYFYADFSCGCVSKQIDIPRFVKVMQVSGISENNYEIYSIRKTTYKHPYMSIINLKVLPAGFTVKSDSCRYSLLDTVVFSRLYNKSTSPDSILLESLKK